jgi:putative Mg2+ transporter-C (MgtC) family protein
MDSLLDAVGRLVVAAVCGAVIGMEREAHAQAAGLRTHMVLAIGAALVMLVSLRIAGDGSGADPGRIAAQVVSGIGFLGAGAILRFGTTVRGLTTAACLWTAAGIGLAVGGGFIGEGIVATALVFLVIWGMEHVTEALGLERELRRLVVTLAVAGEPPARVGELFAAHRLAVRHVGVEADGAGRRSVWTYDVLMPRRAEVPALVRELQAVENVAQVRVE